MKENLYEAPKSDASIEVPYKSSIKRRLMWTARIIITALLYRFINKVAPSFEQTFVSFGTELPLLTRFFIKAYPAFYWPCLVSLLPISFWLINFFNQTYALIIIKASKYNFYLALLCFALFMLAMYLPIFSMGNVV